ncbi:MAG TPA: hypothetical protein VMW83_00560 [Spirochaetia bacterium]|nr:hypothetical protein [Spirochaetia bacterium]
MAAENARMGAASGPEEEFNGFAAWHLCQEVRGLRQDLRADRDRTDSKTDILRQQLTVKIDTLHQETREEFAKVHNELKNDFRWLMGTVLTVLVAITVAILRLAFK